MLLNFIERIEVETARRGNNTWNNPSKLANFSELELSFAVFEARNKTGTKRSYGRKRCRNCGFLLVARWRKERARNPDRASGEDEVLWPTQTRNSWSFSLLSRLSLLEFCENTKKTRGRLTSIGKLNGVSTATNFVNRTIEDISRSLGYTLSCIPIFSIIECIFKEKHFIVRLILI